MLHVAADTDARFDGLSGVLSHASGKRRVLFLDYDGTLVPFADEPHLAHPDAELLDLLQRLCARGDTAIHVVTGRARTSIGGWLGHLDLGLHAEHGCWSRSNPRSEWTLRSRETTEWMRDVRAVMTELVRDVPRSFVEEKERGLAWHYRLSEPRAALPACARLREELAPLLVRHRLEVLAGASVLEIRSRGVDKGLVVADILRSEGDEVFVAAFGDDVTDDDMFGGAAGARVRDRGEPATAAGTPPGPRSSLDPCLPRAPLRDGRESAMSDRRLIIVSNRLPVTVRSEHGHIRITPSAGGLATALGRVHCTRNGEWHGWPGDLSKAADADRRVIGTQLASLGCVPVHLTAAEVAHYYDGFSNGVLWPLLHYQVDKVRLDAGHDWTVYREVNQRFAERVAERIEPEDIVWIHDYQLALVPSMLRELCPWARIGFFLHVPFPAPEVFNILPWRSEVLRGLLGADLVSFHTPGYRRNFCEAVTQTTGAKIVGGALLHGTRVTRTGAHPIGISFAEFDGGAREPGVVEEAERIRLEARGRKIILGVDRLDYTKGIPRRLLAIERLLERSPALREKLLFVQVAVPSREEVDSYAHLRRQVNEQVGRINAHFATPTSAPIQLLYRSVSREQLLALYRAADVMLVTPLRDGMNLVAKEYVAARTDAQGVLILSEFTGAATELHEALSVNPYDLGMVARTIKMALAMPSEEQRTRMTRLRERVAAGDVERWVDGFLHDLEHDDATDDPRAPSEEDEPAVPVGHA